MTIAVVAGGNDLLKSKFSILQAGKGVAFGAAGSVMAVGYIDIAIAVGLSVVGLIAIGLPHFKAVAVYRSGLCGFAHGGAPRCGFSVNLEISRNRVTGDAGLVWWRRQGLVVVIQVENPEQTGGILRVDHCPGSAEGQRIPRGP